MRRRDFLGTAVAMHLQLPRVSAADLPPDAINLARERLRSIMPTRQRVEDFINPRFNAAGIGGNNGWIYDSELGWVLHNATRRDGVNGSKTFYHYEPDGARRVVN